MENILKRTGKVINFIEIQCDCIGNCGILRFYKNSDTNTYWFQYYCCGYYDVGKIERDSTSIELTKGQASLLLSAIYNYKVSDKEEKPVTLTLKSLKHFYTVYIGYRFCTFDIWCTRYKKKKCQWEICIDTNYIKSIQEDIEKVFPELL